MKKKHISETECVINIQGHPNYGFWHKLNVRMQLPFLRYGDLLAENYEFSLPHSHLMPLLRMNCFEFLNEVLNAKTSPWAIHR